MERRADDCGRLPLHRRRSKLDRSGDDCEHQQPHRGGRLQSVRQAVRGRRRGWKRLHRLVGLPFPPGLHRERHR